ncbi:MAG: radical SAM protein [Candidatus Thermoplasmatota archaeon]|nr:radical SAM protein [Candidatus Thermoplasmatota archaeon]
MSYQRELKPGFESFDPLVLTEKTRKIVCSDDSRKYKDFYKVGVYGGIATGYTIGCNLRCYFCWVGPGRDHPEEYGELYSSSEVVKNLEDVAEKSGISKARISGGEPTLCKKHFLKVLEEIERSSVIDTFILETNGVLFGDDREYVKEISKFETLYVRVSLKSGEPEKWEENTGASKKFFELPYRALHHLWKENIDFHVAAMADPRNTSKKEMAGVYSRVAELSEPLAENIEWETIDMYPNTKKRLKALRKEL